MKHIYRGLLSLSLIFLLLTTGCQQQPKITRPISERLGQYITVRLTADLGDLTAAEKQMIPILMTAADQMDAMFWRQAYGDKETLLKTITDPQVRRYAEINYGPWDRLSDNEPFIEGISAKPKGANFYPADMTREEFEARIAAAPSQADALKSLYTVIRRDDSDNLVPRPYHQEYETELHTAAAKLEEAAALAKDRGLQRYLRLRANDLRVSDYMASDLAWMDMKSNRIDVVIGPIETYEDQLFGYKAAAECYILIKDMEWSGRLAKYATMLPDLQRGLPVPEEYKKETPGRDSDLNAYDVVYYAGDCNAGSKTIAINLPNDEQVQRQKGARRLQLKNAMRAKFDRILVPIADLLIDADQREHITFDAFFGNTMFHEVAHGLGIKNTINGKGTVRQALKEQSSTLEEGKADVLGLYMVSRLFDDGSLTEGKLMDNYVTFLASIFRSIRFGASSAHGRANTLRFNFFKQREAFQRDPATGTYKVNQHKMRQAVADLSRKILILQGDGDYAGAQQLMVEFGSIGPDLQGDLDRLSAAGIPVDVTFEQGLDVLGLR